MKAVRLYARHMNQLYCFLRWGDKLAESLTAFINQHRRLRLKKTAKGPRRCVDIENSLAQEFVKINFLEMLKERFRRILTRLQPFKSVDRKKRPRLSRSLRDFFY